MESSRRGIDQTMPYITEERYAYDTDKLNEQPVIIIMLTIVMIGNVTLDIERPVPKYQDDEECAEIQWTIEEAMVEAFCGFESWYADFSERYGYELYKFKNSDRHITVDRDKICYYQYKLLD